MITKITESRHGVTFETLDPDRIALQEKVSSYLDNGICQSCSGKGGFDDTTYDRTGEWTQCNHCHGRGRRINYKRLYDLLGWELK